MQVFETAFCPAGISKSQMKRYLAAMLVSSIVIFIAVFAVVGNLLEYGSSELVYLATIWIIANLFTVRMISGRITYPTETRLKGALYGALAASMSFLIAFSILLFAAMVGDFTEQDIANSSNFGTAALNALLGVLFLFVYGGFLVVPVGGIIGWLFTKNNEIQTT